MNSLHSSIAALLAAGATAALLGRLRDAPMMRRLRPMPFFVSSTGSGKGADLGGLATAPIASAPRSPRPPACRQPHLARLPQHGLGDRWLRRESTRAIASAPARGRNVKGVVIAKDVTELHAANNITKQTALTEKGDVVNGRGDTPNMHDILTGSQPDGTGDRGQPSTRTCGNWTKSGEGAAMVGHSDRTGLDDIGAGEVVELVAPVARLQLSTRFKATGGDARIYCFAAN